MNLEKNIINLTPHTVSIVNGDGETIAQFPSTGLARVASTETVIGMINGIIPLTRTEYGAVEGLPEENGNDIFVVSRVVLNAVREAGVVRSDLVVPGLQVRNEAGLVVGAKALGI